MRQGPAVPWSHLYLMTVRSNTSIVTELSQNENSCQIEENQGNYEHYCGGNSRKKDPN